LGQYPKITTKPVSTKIDQGRFENRLVISPFPALNPEPSNAIKDKKPCHVQQTKIQINYKPTSANKTFQKSPAKPSRKAKPMSTKTLTIKVKPPTNSTSATAFHYTKPVSHSKTKIIEGKVIGKY